MRTEFIEESRVSLIQGISKMRNRVKFSQRFTFFELFFLLESSLANDVVYAGSFFFDFFTGRMLACYGAGKSNVIHTSGAR